MNKIMIMKVMMIEKEQFVIFVKMNIVLRNCILFVQINAKVQNVLFVNKDLYVQIIGQCVKFVMMKIKLSKNNIKVYILINLIAKFLLMKLLKIKYFWEMKWLLEKNKF